jgi:arsenite/tail-anchored protein-transporting ATPase
VTDAAAGPPASPDSSSAAPARSGAQPAEGAAARPAPAAHTAASAQSTRVTRLVFFTGKGGSGVSTLAAATAAHGAQRGLRTLLLSLGALSADGDADDVSVIFNHPIASVPTQVDDLLYAQRFAPQPAFEEWYGKLATRFQSAAQTMGVTVPDATELVAPPGAAEFLVLQELTGAVTTGSWDLVVVDGPSLGPALRLLTLPVNAQTWLRRARPVEGQAARALRPMLASLAGLPLPQQSLVEMTDDGLAKCAAAQQLFADPLTSVRLVATPDTVGLTRLRAARTALSLYGLRLDGVIRNRQILETRDSWSRGWAAAQRIAAEQFAEVFDPVPQYEVPYRPCEPVGLEELAVVAAAAYGAADGLGAPAAPPAPELAGHEGEFTFSVPLPAADRRSMGLVRRGDELVLSVGPYRHAILLPPVLRRCRVAGAVLKNGALDIRFVPDPAQWPAPAEPGD